MKQCIVVANASEARIFFRDGLGPVKEAERLEHPENRQHAGDLEEQGPGAQHESTKSKVRRMDPRTETTEKYAQRFASEVASRLQKIRTQGQAEQLVIAAEPRFLGRLRGGLDDKTAGLVTHTVDKDLTGASIEQIKKSLAI
ncbi:host attachment protein [Aquisalimonas sp.]|uniref:host attachment protein n=1 Tax=Aquisalimonas sp. TaxID=1872621 RepID=UPI0025BED89B|nr:host attachment protein [Aquisalimonas sp.]